MFFLLIVPYHFYLCSNQQQRIPLFVGNVQPVIIKNSCTAYAAREFFHVQLSQGSVYHKSVSFPCVVSAIDEIVKYIPVCAVNNIVAVDICCKFTQQSIVHSVRDIAADDIVHSNKVIIIKNSVCVSVALLERSFDPYEFIGTQTVGEAESSVILTVPRNTVVPFYNIILIRIAVSIGNGV